MSLNVGKSIGRVSIRALPDTKDFRRDLLRKLRAIEKTTKIGVTVDRARVDRAKIRQSIERQLEGLDRIAMDADVAVTIDKAKLKKVALRKSIQEQFDQLGDIRVGIAAHIRNEEEFQRQVRSMVREASRNGAAIDVNARTAAATAQMRWLSRDRFVNLIPRVSKAAAAKAAATLAALSGGRVAFNWVDDLLRWLGDLDKKLPVIALATTGLTTLGSVLLGAVSGIVGIGQGLVAMTPLLLLVPGLLLNAAGSLTVLGVALRDASEQLAPLKDDMSELRDIISSGFWAKAREPIINLIDGLMPQLRNAFGELSDGVGGFVGNLADSFAKHLGGGRLEAIFANINEGWRILSTGTDGFAGAIVSLSEIAAKYTPRLSQWFVRQVDTFDAWLTAIATDGRLDQWIEEGIAATYALWDATTGIAGQFRALWRAAEAAGSGGLRGFADTMQRWSDVMNGERFQKGMTALFRGANEALEGLGDGLAAFGTLIADNSADFEYFIATSGRAFGGLLEDIADALNQPIVARGFRDFIDGIRDGFDGFGDYLPRIGQGFGTLLSTAGALAAELGPVLGSALGSIAEILTPIAETLRDSVIPVLGPALVTAFETLTPKLETLAEKLAPVIEQLAELAVNVLPLVVDGLGLLADAVGVALDGFNAGTQEDREAGNGDLLSGFGELFRFSFESSLLDAFSAGDSPFGILGALASGDMEKALDILQQIEDGEFGVMWQDIAIAAQGLADVMTGVAENLALFFEDVNTNMGLFGEQWANFWAGNGWVTNAEMANIEGDVRRGMGGGFSAMSGFQTQGQPLWQGFLGNLVSWGATAWNNIVTSVQTGVGNAIGWIASLPGRAAAALGNLAGTLFESGKSLLQGFINGITSMIGTVATAVANAVETARQYFPFSPAKLGPFSGRGWTAYSGAALMDGFAEGIRNRANAPREALAEALGGVLPEVPSFEGVAAAATGGGAAPVQRITNITNNNPAPEPASTSITRALDKVAYLGLDDEDGDI